MAEDPGPTVVVVAHGAVNRALIGRLLGLDPAHALRVRQDWAGVNVLELAAGRWWLGVLNWTPLGLEEWRHTRPPGRRVGEETWGRLGR
jgi:broad specificity phosphatase PhoE